MASYQDYFKIKYTIQFPCYYKRLPDNPPKVVYSLSKKERYGEQDNSNRTTTKKAFLLLILINAAICLILYYALLITGFLSGYASNNTHLTDEIWLFIGFFIFHLIINIFLLYRFRQLNWVGISVSILLVVYYLVEAWQFGYFNKSPL